MSLLVKESGVAYDPVPADMHHAICIGVFDLGSHYSAKFDKTTHKCLLMWELPDVRINIKKDGMDVDVPRLMSKQYSLSLNEKSILYKDLVSWRGRTFTEQELQGFDLKNLLGVNCMLQVIHASKDGKTYANISSVLPLYKGIPSSKPQSDILYFSFEDNDEIPEDTPKWIAEIIKLSSEYIVKTTSVDHESRHAEFNDNDDVPF